MLTINGRDSMEVITETTITDTIAVPGANSTDNILMRDVVGNKTDKSLNMSLVGKMQTGYEHIHMPAKIYPNVDAASKDDIRVTTNAAAWTLGNAVEVVPVNTITKPFDIHWLNISNMSAVGTYEIVLYISADAGLTTLTEIGRVRVTCASNQTKADNTFTQGQVIPANSRIAAKAADSTTSGRDVDFSIHYHEYNV